MAVVLVELVGVMAVAGALARCAACLSLSFLGHCAKLVLLKNRANRRFSNGHAVPRETSAMQQALPRFDTKSGPETAPRIPISPHQCFAMNAATPFLRQLYQPERTPIMQSNPLMDHCFDRMSLRHARGA